MNKTVNPHMLVQFLLDHTVHVCASIWNNYNIFSNHELVEWKKKSIGCRTASSGRLLVEY